MALPARVMLGWPIYSDIGPLYAPQFSLGSWSPNAPLINLQDRHVTKVARTLDATAVNTKFKIDLQTDRLVRLIALVGHNLSTEARVRFMGVPATDPYLFRYDAGDDYVAKGGTFTRATSATYIDKLGYVRAVGGGVLRDNHYENGVRTTLMEVASTNLIPADEDLNNTTYWTKTGVSVPVTLLSGDLLVTLLLDDSGAASEFLTSVATFVFTKVNPCWSFFAKAGTSLNSVGELRDTVTDTRRGKVAVAWNADGTPASVALTNGVLLKTTGPDPNGVYRFEIQATGCSTANAHTVRLFPVNEALGVTATGSCYFGGIQVEDAEFSTSLIKTSTVAVTRNVDLLDFAGVVPGSLTGETDDLTAYVSYQRPARFDNSVMASDARSPYALSTGALSARPYFSTVFPNWAAQITGLTGGDANTTGLARLGGASQEHVMQLKDLTVLPAVAQDVGGGLGAFASGAGGASGAFTNFTNTTLRLGGGTGAWIGGIQRVRLARGLKTMTQMRTGVINSGWLAVFPPIYPAGSLAPDDPRMAAGFSFGRITAEDAIDYVPIVLAVPDPAVAVRNIFVDIDDPNNPAGYVELGRVVVTGAYQPSMNPRYGLRLGYEDLSVRSETEGGSAVFNRKPKRRAVTMSWDGLPQDEALVNLLEFVRKLGITEQFLFTLDPTGVEHLHRWSFLATSRELSSLEFPDFARNSWAASFVEDI